MHDIRTTREEAERWLEVLESNRTRTKVPPAQVEPVSKSITSQEVCSEKEQANPALLSLILIILFTPFILLAVYLSGFGRSPLPASPVPLGYAESCGSISSSTGRWWPVLGPADRSFLTTIRNRFCADAYISSEGALQVASFGSREEAERFRMRIEQATGQSFRVGNGR